eukprot:TRINITY_DN73_c1_g1_i1.p1 TRINITY_DN73_c1_g1~~TRINITY_DN73_c1_g1_i1.p1  ORF type:complete len:651 (+),score=169.09 TRINITY_DN73_c1_g1_i1:1135-3087(+)
MARRTAVDEFTLPSELLGEAPGADGGTSLNPLPKTPYQLWAQCDEDNTLRRRLRSQEDPGCRFSFAVKTPGAPRPRDHPGTGPSTPVAPPLAPPTPSAASDASRRGDAPTPRGEKSAGQSLFSNFKKGARLMTSMSRGGARDDGKREIPKGYRDLVLSVQYHPVARDEDPAAAGAREGGIPEDTVYTAVSNCIRYRQGQTTSVIAVSDVGERGRGNALPLVQITFSVPVLSHCLDANLDLAVGFVTGDVVVFNLAAGFIYRAEPPARTGLPKGALPTGAKDTRDAKPKSAPCHPQEDVGCTAVAFTAAPHGLLTGHVHGAVHLHNIARGQSLALAAMASPMGASSPGFSFSRRGSESGLGSQSSQSSFAHTPRGFGSRKGSASVPPHATSVLEAKVSKSPVLHLAVSRGEDGGAAAACENGDCVVLHEGTLKPLFVMGTKFGAATACSWSGCGKFLAVGGQDDMVALYAVCPLTRLAYLTGACSWITSISVHEVNANGTLLVAAVCLDGRLYLWEVEAALPADLASPTLSLSQIHVGSAEGGQPQPTRLPAPKWDSVYMVPEIDAVASLARLHHGLPLHGLAVLPQFRYALATVCAAGILKVWTQRPGEDGAAAPAAPRPAEDVAPPPPQLHVVRSALSSGRQVRPAPSA